MYKTITFNDFCDGFSGGYANNFTYEGKRALFDYLEALEDDTGEKIELDTIALCCEYSEFDSAYEAMQEYQPENMPIEGEEGDDLIEIQEKNEAAALEWLQERTQVIEISDRVGFRPDGTVYNTKMGVIIQSF